MRDRLFTLADDSSRECWDKTDPLGVLLSLDPAAAPGVKLDKGGVGSPESRAGKGGRGGSTPDLNPPPLEEG